MQRRWIILGLLVMLSLAACKNETEEPTQEATPFLGIESTGKFEGDTQSTMAFRVRLSSASDRAVSLRYETVDGSATAGEDYVAIPPSTLTFAPGESESAIEVTILGDTEREVDEVFTIQLSDVVGAQISSTEATGTIRNDDEYDDLGEIGDEGYRSPDNYDGYNLVWQDEFNDGQLSSDWIYELGDGCPNLCGWGNNELQTYTDRPENLYFQEGKLVIEARQESFNGSAYTSSRIITKGQQSFQYGRIDLRAKLPYGQGIWPALWMLGDNIDQVGWPACGEIDIMELVGHEPDVVHGTIHWATEPDGQRAQFGGSYSLDAGIFYDAFHVFSIIWTEDEIRWLVDDQPYHSTNIESSDLDEFRNSFFFIFNIAVGGDWPGSPDGTTIFPQRMAVDYVRVFQAE